MDSRKQLLDSITTTIFSSIVLCWCVSAEVQTNCPGTHLVRGDLKQDGSFQFKLTFHIPKVTPDRIRAESPKTKYRFVCADFRGKILSEHPVWFAFDPMTMLKKVGRLPFVLKLGIPEGTSRLSLMHEGKSIGELQCSAHIPTITLQKPDYDEAKSLVTIQWNVADLDSTDFSCLIHFFSHKNQSTFRDSFVGDIKDGMMKPEPRILRNKDVKCGKGFIRFNTDSLVSGTYNRFRFILSDGLNSTIAWSDPVTASGGVSVKVSVYTDGRYVMDGTTYTKDTFREWILKNPVTVVRFNLGTKRGEGGRVEGVVASEVLKGIQIKEQSYQYFVED